MYLKSLSLINFKNIAQAQLEFSPSINALVGDNGAGKTNVVDAIHYLSLAKSMMVMTDRQSVRHGEPFFVVDGALQESGGGSKNVVCTFSRQQAKGIKTLKCNGKEYDKLSDHVGVVPVVVVAPQDISLVYEGGEERRRFLNSLISQFDSSYLNSLMRYNATLNQRNSLLKQHGEESILQIYDEQLAHHGEAIYRRRREIIEMMQPQVEEFYTLIAGERESITLEYSSHLCDGESFADLLAASRDKDRQSEYTTAGVHRDDLTLKINGYPLRKYGSQGQQKSYLVALKLAHYNIISHQREESPILLLDDLFDKLDNSRVERLLQIVGGEAFGQIFITDCNKQRLEAILSHNQLPYTLHEVSGGEVESKKSRGDNLGEF